LQVKVEKAPLGAVRTKSNLGGDEEKDSDLSGDGLSDRFILDSKVGDTVPYSSTDLGYRTPGSVKIRVWDDINSDGKQQENEPGIPGVKLQLLKSEDKSAFEDRKDGGNVHKELTTGEDGFVTFTMVPQHLYVVAKVLNMPGGAIPTGFRWMKRSQHVENDNDLMENGLTREFVVTDNGEGVTDIDVGFKMPMDMQVRVWDDANNNGE
jgi:hypothetical protein